jgi:hypothetical protein
MKALLRIILFVTTDVDEKVKKYSNDDKTAMILIYGEYNKKKPSNTLWKNVPLLNSSKVSPNYIYLPKTP